MSEVDLSCPRPEHKGFEKYWNIIVGDIKDRKNVKESHIPAIRMLCDLYVEYDELKDILDVCGRTYDSIGRNGKQIKMRPEVSQLNTVVSRIKDYLKVLNIVLYKDTKTKDDGGKNEFD